ncbi:MAG: polymer-forming cytoskeletal protein [Pseudomonadota bacterium]
MSKQAREGDLSVYLGSESSLTGELNFNGQARLDGRFSGQILGSGTLFIGPKAQVQAQVRADTVVIQGELIGDVEATHRLELKAPGRLKGNISAPLVVMDEGVVFEGHCSMTGDAGEAGPRGKITLLATRG